MTICIAATCNDGRSVIVASDTMVTNPGISIEFEHPGPKITKLSPTCVALTAGDALAHTELFDMVQSEIEQLNAPPVQKIVREIKECYQAVRQREIVERVLAPRGIPGFGEFYKLQSALSSEVAFTIQARIDTYDYGLSILVAGISGPVAHIYGVSDPGTSQCYDAVNFHAIGSGTPHALNTLIARSCHSGTPLMEALLIVYEAKKMAEKAPGVGGVTDISILTEDCITDLPRQSVERLAEVYEKWTRCEETWDAELRIILGEPRENADEGET